MATMVRAAVGLLVSILRSCGALFRTRREQAIVELALRQQLAVYVHKHPRPRLSPLDRAFWVALSRVWPRWTTFLRNHRDLIAGMDFFVVPTVHFRLLCAWSVIDHGRRRILHFNATAHPSAAWVSQQLRDAFPDVPRHRYLISDNDSIFSSELVHALSGFGICPKRTALQSPWQNGTAERFVGSIRRELLDHVVILHEDYLRRLLREYIDYYNGERVHTAIGDAPEGREVELRPADGAKVVSLPRVGGLHHRYVWSEAA